MLFLLMLDTEEEKILFQTLYDKHAARMLFYAQRRLKDHGAAEEVVQDVFFKIAANIRILLDMDEPSRDYYCFTILRRHTINRWKKDTAYRERIGKPTKEDRISPEDIERKAILSEEVKRVAGYVASMPEIDRQILYYALFTRLTNRQIARLFDTTANGVRSRLKRMRGKIRNYFQGERKK